MSDQPRPDKEADPQPSSRSSASPSEGFDRRTLLAAGGAAGLGALAGRYGAPVDSQDDVDAVVPFHGAHQAGIVTPPQTYAQVTAFDFTGGTVPTLRDLLQAWTHAASRLSGGLTVSPDSASANLAPIDPGEALGLKPARLTLTFGLGPSLFEARDTQHLRPASLQPLPPFAGDALEARYSGGDLCIQACSDDQQVAFHAIHALSRIAAGAAVPRWSQAGFRGQGVHRNVLGFKDGTRNLNPAEAPADGRQVWVGPRDAPNWMRNGTYMVVRRIRALLDVWDTTSLDGQQRAVGRAKASGAPLSGTHHDDQPDLHASGNEGPLIPTNAHIRLAAPETNRDVKLLRRGYSYADGVDEAGQLDAGLIFVCFQRDPRTQFVPMQRDLAVHDALSKHILHVGSAVFACPPGTAPNGFLGQHMFEPQNNR